MTETTQTAEEKEKLGTAQPVDAPEPIKNEPIKKEKKKHRTRGLWLFDVILYNLANALVFGISVYATYMTTHGRDKKDDGTYKHNAFAQLLSVRGEALMSWLKDRGLTHDQADMAKMVTFSFLDGTLVAPLVKLGEDRREKIAYWLDTKMGTVHPDKAIYEAEPKQTWASVIFGRLAVASIIVPTAVALDRMGTQDGKWSWKVDKSVNTETEKKAKSLNDIMFNDPGEKYGEKVAKGPHAKYFGGLNIPYLYKTFAFEAFYTTVCTVGLYFSSRLIARLTGKHKPTAEPLPQFTPSKFPAVHSTNSNREPAEKVEAKETEKKFSSENLKSAAPTAAPEQFSDRPKAPAETPGLVYA